MYFHGEISICNQTGEENFEPNNQTAFLLTYFLKINKEGSDLLK